MNKTYALVWNQAQGCWSAVGETARRHGKSAGGKRLAAAAVSLLGLAALPAFALPTGEAITAGKADILRDVDGKSMSVNQHTDKLVTNWQSFDVAGGERVSFHQPGSQSIALNRVIGNNGSQIHGSIDANGKVFLVNPNGMVFGSGAQVNVGGLVASTQAISDADFLAGNYRFAGHSAASIVNDGKITAADGGSVALLGARVSNNGVIQAKMGRVALGAGNAFKVNFDGNDLLSLQVEGGAVDAQATNGGMLKADGGEVLMTARAAGNLLNAVVNNSGTIEAKGLASRGGKISLDGDTVNVGGTLDASGAQTGSVVTRGQRVNVAADTNVDTRAGNTAGTWSIEAANAGVNGTNGGDRSIAADTLSRNLGTTNVALTNTQGDLSVDGPLAWNSDNALTLASQQGNVDLQRTVSATGEHASLRVDAADTIHVNDAVSLTGRAAHLGLNARNGHTLASGKAVTLSGDNASFRSNGHDYKVLHTVDDLRRVDNDLNGRYVVGNAIDGRGANFRSIGANSAFTGDFDGLGNTVSRLNVANPGQYAVGLFAKNSGRIANLALDSVAVTGDNSNGNAAIGGLVGDNFGGRLSNVSATNTAVAYTGKTGWTMIGGLVGRNVAGQIDRARFAGKIAGSANTFSVGGLVGYNMSGSIADSHASADVMVAGSSYPGLYANVQSVGGLVGTNTGTLSDVSAGGRVTAGNHANVGGLVGHNDGGTIRRAVATVDVTAGKSSHVGGFVGWNHNGASIEHASASGKVNASGAASIGGFAGNTDGKLNDVASKSIVTDTTSNQIGGLAGVNGGFIGNASATGAVNAGSKSQAGGLVGVNTGTIDTAKASVNVLAGANSLAGGLIGTNRGGNAIVRHASATGNVTAQRSQVGGLVGVNDAGALIADSTSTGTIGGEGSDLGGLVAQNSGTIRSSRSGSKLNLPQWQSTAFQGGLVALNYGSIDSSSTFGPARDVNTIGLNLGKVDGKFVYGPVR
ncbi:TPA: filamentous hemagglutinin N-terminal domain-containing protein [Burkholderia cenocepacia]|uniref:two-partner secretion domain-containing protein n=1 Tax=unclassified Burkholderia TaxID=2613784 RepID=UPI00158CAF03|nr:MULTISPECIES: GLUG motif-containing protein [unclassified Burkholderia]HEF5873627.1 filamentous hemagglutinin N-terminal domain-containing protein [Burkholderia cenocepacia]